MHDYKATYTDDLVGNRLKKTIDDLNDASIDQISTYLYDENDRLVTEDRDTNNDTVIDETVAYEYGSPTNPGTQQTKKTVTDTSTSNITQSTSFTYNLQGRMKTGTTDSFDSTGTLTRKEVTTFEYDDDGIRVTALHEVDSDANGGFETRTLTEYLIDAQNLTGYQQILQETVSDADTGEIQKKVIYAVGTDVISQTTIPYSGGVPGTPETLVFLYDGHGSVRAVADMLAAILENYDYDAYGNPLGFDPATALTAILYAGEYLQKQIGLYNNRARYYNSATGTFNRLDTFAGNTQDPQSLHKYAYGHSDPVNNIDPEGTFILGFLGGMYVGLSLRSGWAANVLITGGIIIDFLAWSQVLFFRNMSAWLYPRGIFIPVDKSRLESHYHSIRIRNSGKTADQIFRKMARFSELNTYPTVTKDNATAVGDVITWDMDFWFYEVGQADFQVKVTKLDPQTRTFVVRTLGGHPLAGWRLWRVRTIQGGDIIIETFSVEHPATEVDNFKLNKMGGLTAMYGTWTNMLQDLLDYSGGQPIPGPDSVPDGDSRADKVKEYLSQVE